MFKKLSMSALLGFTIAIALPCQSAITISAGTHLLVENTPGQTIEILISTDTSDTLQNIVLNVQVADSGPGLGGGVIDGPTITAIDSLTGTIFAGNNNGDNGAGVILDQLANSSVVTQSGSVPAQGLLSTLTIDTTGFFAGSIQEPWDLFVSDTVNGPTSAIGADFVFQDGSIQLIPKGDLNGDGVLTDSDISAFVQALTDPTGYAAAFHGLDPDLLGDFSGDGSLTNSDIGGFVAAIENLGVNSSNVPEPASITLLLLGGAALLHRNRS